MSSVPFSIRLPVALVELLNALSKKTGMSPPDTMRAVLESSVHGNAYRLIVVERLKEPYEVIKRVRSVLRENSSAKLEPEDCSALLHFFHWAYMSGDGFATPQYVATLLDLTAELISQLEEVGVKDEGGYARSKLGLVEGESLRDGVDRIKREFAANPSVSWAEFLIRPLEGIADELQFLERSKIHAIFQPRLDRVLPVAVRGAKATVDGELIDWDMRALLPPAESFKLGALSVTLYAHPIAIMVEEGHHCYPFSPESVLGIATGIANDVFERMISQSKSPLTKQDSFRRSKLDIARCDDSVLLHENSGYRLILSIAEFTEFIKNLELQFAKPGWIWLLKRHCDLRGDF